MFRDPMRFKSSLRVPHPYALRTLERVHIFKMLLTFFLRLKGHTTLDTFAPAFVAFQKGIRLKYLLTS